jgi:hypothetical protein
MSKIICNSVDFIFTHEVASINPSGIPIPKDGWEWNRINTSEKPVYQSNVKQNDAGPTNEETVSFKTRHNDPAQLLMQCIVYHALLQIKTDNKTFYMGSLEYPSALESTTDQVFATYSFKALSPAV